ncbi:MAG TPA: hypothetical protein VI386_24865 [Candidatus Sulfotelmatobacter sp.]
MADSNSAVSNLPEGYSLEQQPAAPPQGGVPGLPAGYKLESADTQQSAPATTLTDGGSVPNARIRNLPNPAAKATGPGDALLDGMKTGAQLASIPSTVAGIGAGVEASEGVATSFVDKARTVYQWAKANPLKAAAIEGIAREVGVDPIQLAHKVVKYGKGLFGDSEDQ